MAEGPRTWVLVAVFVAVLVAIVVLLCAAVSFTMGLMGEFVEAMAFLVTEMAGGL